MGAELQAEYLFNENIFLLGGISFENLEMSSYDLQRNYQVIGFIPRGNFGNHDNLTFEQKNKDRQVYTRDTWKCGISRYHGYIKGIESEITIQLTKSTQVFANFSHYKAEFSWGAGSIFNSSREFLEGLIIIN